MRKVILFLSVIFFLTFFAEPSFANLETCSLNPPRGALPGGELTYTFKWPEQKNLDYTFFIKSTNSGSSFSTQEQITIDDTGLFEKTFSAPDTVGNYRIYITPVSSPTTEACSITFQVFNSSGAACPPAVNSTTLVNIGEDVILKFQAPFTGQMNFEVDTGQKIRVDAGTQEVNIGQGYTSGSHTVRISDATSPTTQCTATGFCVGACNESNLCCPAGFGTSPFQCAFGTDTSKKCCRRFDFGQYETVDKIACDGGSVTGNYCCPAGSGTGAIDCPAFTDLTKQCCKHNSLGGYEKVDKIQCTLTKDEPAPAPIKNKLIDCEKAGGRDSTFIAECKKCLGSDPTKPKGIYTALGCLKTEPANLIGNIFGIILSIAGGVALLLIIYSGYRMITAAGNPEALQGARETLTSAIVGLLFIIFSFVILQILGVDILHLPGFGN